MENDGKEKGFFSLFRKKRHKGSVDFKFISENVIDVIWILGQDFRFEYVTPSVEKLLGYIPEEIKGKHLADLSSQGKFEKMREDAKKVLAAENLSEYALFETELVHKDGHKVPVEVSARYLTGTKGFENKMFGITRDISERKKHEQKVAELEKIFNRSHNAIFIWLNEPGWKIEFVSENVKGLLGYSAEDFISGEIKYSAVVHPDDIDRVNDEVKKNSLDPDRTEFYHEPYRLLNNKGDFIWVRDWTEIVRNDKGQIIKYRGIVSDITRQKTAEEKIQHLNRVLFSIRCVNQLIIKEKDPEKIASGTIRYLIESGGYENAWIELFDNKGSFRYLPEKGIKGFSPELKKILENGGRVKCQQKALEKKEAVSIENPKKTCLGCPLDSEYSGKVAFCSPLMDKDNLYGTITVALPYNIAAIQEEKDLFRELAADLSYAFTSLHLEKRTHKMNREIRQYVNELEEKNKRMDNMLRNAAINREIMISMLEDNNKIREELENKLRELNSAQKMLLRSEKLISLGRLVSEMAHEVNNPLQAIAGRAQLSLMGTIQDKELEEHLKTIENQSFRAKEIIKRLLLFSKPSKGVVSVKDLKEITENTLKLVDKYYLLSDIVIDREYSPEEVKVEVDVVQIEEVIFNVLKNAFEAMKEGGHITVVVKKDDDSGFVEIRDTGEGIPKEVNENMFDPFYTTKEEGTGLGLSICYGIIKEHDGEIYYDSVVGEGTTAVIKLPLKKEE